MPKEKGPPLSSVNRLLIEEAEVLYDQINQNWLTLEAHIQESGVLKPVVISLGQDEYGDSHYLGVQKLNGKWRVCTGETPQGYPDDAGVRKWSPVADSSIQDRIHLFARAQELYTAVVKSNGEVVENLREAATNADDTLRSLGLK